MFSEGERRFLTNVAGGMADGIEAAERLYSLLKCTALGVLPNVFVTHNYNATHIVFSDPGREAMPHIALSIVADRLLAYSEGAYDGVMLTALEHRLSPEPDAPVSVFDVLATDWRYVAADSDGKVYAYVEEPHLGVDDGRDGKWLTGDRYQHIDALAPEYLEPVRSLPWRESLLVRGYE